MAKDVGALFPFVVAWRTGQTLERGVTRHMKFGKKKKQLLCHLWEVDNVLSSVEYLEEKFSDLIYNYGS